MAKLSRKILVLGGHKLAVNYLERMQKATFEGRFPFVPKFFCVDSDEHCVVKTGGAQRSVPLPDVAFIHSSYVDFLTDSFFDSQNWEESYLIPDHTAPHVFFQLFLNLIKKKLWKATLLDFSKDIVFPFQKKVHEGVYALSYATWICPPECDEPEVCPAIEGERTWNFSRMILDLKPAQASFPVYSVAFSCEQLVDGIAYLPLQKLFNAWNLFKKELERQKSLTLTLTTHSKCHAILGMAEISIK